ncbi:MAG: GIY-YIG nuclease family protein [Eubacteriales bacterium]
MDKQSRKSLSKQYKDREVIGGVYRVVCRPTGQFWLKKTTDMQGSKNRHDFSIITNHCPEPSMQACWKQYGAKNLVFEEMELLTKKEAQSFESFSEDVGVLLEFWEEKLGHGTGE